MPNLFKRWHFLLLIQTIPEIQKYFKDDNKKVFIEKTWQTLIEETKKIAIIYNAIDFSESKTNAQPNSKIIIGNGVLQKALRFLKDSIDSADNLVAIHRHRTPISLKAYCLMFV